ncbi:hypothetical protein FEZ60_04430 [Rhodococcus sp. MS16]|nr:hypothetical protein [Rhodococcus sp. MS16]ROZ46676.1 hypothetical protein EEB13_14540 [Rhodococcus sp. WS3]RZL25639.1 MAG: hypothetical protein EOP31_09420 [Rhodococcus sp. (in: high G+C Gram-positive bacteria)]TSD50421.1 hypothetical protein FFI94_016680 [Rhodococcus sp. KBS0724]
MPGSCRDRRCKP